MGTAVGTEVFVNHGWRAAAALSMGWYGWQLLVLLARGPHVKRYTWFGYEGGIEARKSIVDAREKTLEAGEAGDHGFAPDRKTDPEAGSDQKDSTETSQGENSNVGDK
jgi:hypothetical protein